MSLLGNIAEQIADEYLDYIGRDNSVGRGLITAEEYLLFRNQAIKELPYAKLPEKEMRIAGDNEIYLKRAENHIHPETPVTSDQGTESFNPPNSVNIAAPDRQLAFNGNERYPNGRLNASTAPKTATVSKVADNGFDGAFDSSPVSEASESNPESALLALMKSVEG